MGDFRYKASKTGIQVHINNEPCHFDGFLSYGYRKKTSMEVYLFIARILEENGVVCLHDHKIDRIVNNKLLQSLQYSKANVPIPDTYEVFNSDTALRLVETIDEGTLPCVLKPLDDYGGEGLLKYDNKYRLISELKKTHWNSKNLLIQKMVPDSIGHSIRVLCFDGKVKKLKIRKSRNNLCTTNIDFDCKAFALAEYEDKSGGFTSNFCFGDSFRLISLMDHPKYDVYRDIGERAVKSIGNLLIGGVDLLDSKEKGVVVLEVNGWPDIYDVGILLCQPSCSLAPNG